MIGPFPRTAPQLFLGEPSIDFARAHDGATGPVAWKAHQADPTTGRVDLDALKKGAGGAGYDPDGSPDLCTFAYAEIDSDRDGPGLMLLGSSGTLIVTVNERVVLDARHPEGRPYSADADLVRFPLAKGRNRILVLTRQGIGRWAFGVQVARGLAKAETALARAEALRAFATQHKGDPSRGEALFFNPRRLDCARCHAANGRGTAAIGPDLTGIARKYDRDELIRSVLEPSRRIAVGYQPVVVSTRDGRVISGIVRAETDDLLELADAGAKTTRIPKRDIELRRTGGPSIMPAHAAESLSPAEFADLISFLSSLKQPPTRP